MSDDRILPDTNGMSDLLDQLRDYEERLHRFRRVWDSSVCYRLLHPDFEEFGRSGNRHVRNDVIAAFCDGSNDLLPIQAEDFRLIELTDTVALLTYRTDRDTPRSALRSSI